ncbi:uncharacterized protein [Centruroides vittatus]|uniref:uncharacterized protein n=1 Tax=Centruroides vittatus TaxID=120091 RepID=UPI003510418A
MKRRTYNEALMDYIEKTECEKINSNLIGSLDRRVRKLEVSKLSKVLPFLKKCRNPRPGTPRLFAFAKVHKTGKEIRPVVEKCRGPTFVLEKKLHEYLSLQLDTDTLVARDPMKVVKDLQSIALMEDEVATVFDYESMYPSVRIESCEEALLDFLYSNNSELLSYTEEVESLTSLVCRESCFVFNGQVYRQRRGVPMGSSLSGILCELVVRRLEKRIFHGFKDDIVYFSRYVDDLLILWRSNSRIKDFLDKINDNNDGLTLRLEQKSSLNLHFLDIDITFKKGHLSTSVFIKPSHSPLYIPSQSKDPYKYKIAAFRALIRRAFLYCERVQDRTKEINRIISVARTLGYQKSTILGIIKKYENNIKKRCFKNAPNKFVKFTYNERDSAYPLQTWLLTPVGNPSTAAELNYNAAHKKARNTIERCFGVLKQRFRCLDLKSAGGLQYVLEKSAKIVMACAILHNICVAFNIPTEEICGNDDDDDDGSINEMEHSANQNAVNVRQQLILQRFC